MADSPDAPEDELSEEGARRLVLFAVAALVFFLLAAGVALAINLSDDSGGDDQVVAAEPLAGTGTGPLQGTDLATYAEGRNRALREARGRWVAVVSLRDYLTEDQVRSTFPGLKVEALLVASPSGEPAVVKGPLARWGAEARTAAEEERRNLEQMIATTEDKAFQDQFRADIERLGKMIASLDPAKPVVFGMVVTGPADDLRSLAGHSEVRLVDLVGRRMPWAVERLRGLRPEETVKSGVPPARPPAP